MTEVDVRFEREERDGVVAVGTYLIDAALRFGIEVEAECDRRGQCDSCVMTIKHGGELFSEVTKAEIEHLPAARRKKGQRLACQAKFEKSGEVVVMTKEKIAEEKPEAKEKSEDYKKKFEELPLEKKIASLLELEVIALSETVSFVINSPFKIFDKAMDVMAEFGLKMDDEAKKGKRPKEHKAEDNGHQNGEKAEVKPKKKRSRSSSKKKPAAKKKKPLKES